MRSKRYRHWEGSRVKKEAANLTSLKHGEDEGISAANGMSCEVPLVPCAAPGNSSLSYLCFLLGLRRSSGVRASIFFLSLRPETEGRVGGRGSAEPEPHCFAFSNVGYRNSCSSDPSWLLSPVPFSRVFFNPGCCSVTLSTTVLSPSFYLLPGMP